jgi:hypothetical protein
MRNCPWKNKRWMYMHPRMPTSLTRTIFRSWKPTSSTILHHVEDADQQLEDAGDLDVNTQHICIMLKY